MRNSTCLLSINRPKSLLRWFTEAGHSIRAYDFFPNDDFSLCVSAKSAELLIVVEGEIVIEMGYFKETVLLNEHSAGIILMPGTPHRFMALARTKSLVIDLDPYTRELSSPIGWIALPTSLRRKIKDSLIYTVYQPVQQRSLNLRPLMAQLRLEHIGTPQQLESGHNTALLSKAKRYLDGHYASAINIDLLAKTLGMNRFYLTRAFKQNFSFSPSEYIQTLRREHFLCSLKTNPRQNLIQLAFEAGFNDYASFCRLMKKYYGMPPSKLAFLPTDQQ